MIPSARPTQDQLRPEREGDRDRLRWAGEGDGAPPAQRLVEPVRADERPAGNVLRIWIPLPLAVAVGVVAVVAVAVLISQSVPGAVFVLGVFMVAPGYALVRLLGLRDLALEGVLSVALSLALAGILSTIQAYVGAWSPAATVGLLLAITIGALVARPLLALARRLQPRLASWVRSTGVTGPPARRPELVATLGVPAMRPGAAPLLSKIATTRYGDTAGAVRPVGAMARSTAGAPAPGIGQPPTRAFELAPRAAETAPGVGFELKPAVEPTLRLPFELPHTEPVTAEAEELPAWARRPVGQPSASVPPPRIVEVTPRAVVSTGRAAGVPAASARKARAKPTRTAVEPSRAIAGTSGGRSRKPAAEAVKATPVPTPVATARPRRKTPAVIEAATVPPARRRSQPTTKATPKAESASTRASATPVGKKAPAAPVPSKADATTRKYEPAATAPLGRVDAASARRKEPAKPVAKKPAKLVAEEPTKPVAIASVAAPVRRKPAPPATPAPIATPTAPTPAVRKTAPRSADMPPPEAPVAASRKTQAPPAVSAKPPKVDRPAALARAVAPAPKKPPRVAKAAAVAPPAAPASAPVIHRRPRPAGGEHEATPRRRGTLADDALAESGATRTFRSAIEHVIDDLAEQRDRTRK